MLIKDNSPLSDCSASASTPRIWHWMKKDLPPHHTPENQLFPAGHALRAKTPFQMFTALLDEGCMQHLVTESNRYRLKENKTRVNPVTLEEMNIFIGINFYMSVVHLPNRRMYRSPKSRQAIVADVMPVNRYEEILSILHANDNDLEKKRGQAGYDSLHKVRPLIDLLSASFEKCAQPEVCVSVDEQIIPFKGRHNVKV